MSSELFSIKGKVAVVTGGSRGIGLMIARGFVRAGARVYISARKAEACNAAATELSKIGECISVPADLGTLEGVRHLAGEVSAREKRLHVLVNNAGATWGAPLEEFPESGWEKIIAINVKGVFQLTVELLPLLRRAASKEDPARVINIGSIDGIRVPRFDNFSYSASKAGVHMLTRHLADQARPGEHHRERHRARALPEQDDSISVRRSGRRERLLEHPDGPPRTRGRHRRHRDLSVVTRRLVPDRRGDSSGWRRHDVTELLRTLAAPIRRLGSRMLPLA